jgi:hypothetical protein
MILCAVKKSMICTPQSLNIPWSDVALSDRSIVHHLVTTDWTPSTLQFGIYLECFRSD